MARESRLLPPDNHVHTEWSWDAVDSGSMERTCERALALGLPSVAFTEHADFVTRTFFGDPGAAGASRLLDTIGNELDVDGYLECLERCRARFPNLRILSGVELGEPHLFPEQVRRLFEGRSFDRVLGSVHYMPWNGAVTYTPALLAAHSTSEVMRLYFAETLKLIEACDRFEVLAHLDYPARTWPKAAPPYDARDFEDEIRAVLRALARSGRILELNTNGPCPAERVVRWWHEEGGPGLSFGSDAHAPSALARGFDSAAAAAEACGFRPARTPFDFWRR